MKRVILNEAQIDQLRSVTASIDLCDSNGIIIGRFFPEADASHYVSSPHDIRESRSRLDDARDV